MQSLAQVNFDSQVIKTMSSRDIAAHTGKDHKHVMRDCVNMFHELILLPKEYAQDWAHPQNGQTYQEYVLDEDLVMTLIAGYSVKLRHAVIKRWKELEAKQSILLPNFTDPAEAAIAWAAEFKAKQHAETQLSIAAPKAQALDLICDTAGLFGIRESAKTLKVTQSFLVTLLIDKRWMYRDSNKVLQGYSDRIEQDYIKHVMSKPVPDKDGIDHVYQSAKLTTKGLTRLAQIISKGV